MGTVVSRPFRVVLLLVDAEVDCWLIVEIVPVQSTVVKSPSCVVAGGSVSLGLIVCVVTVSTDVLVCVATGPTVLVLCVVTVAVVLMGCVVTSSIVLVFCVVSDVSSVLADGVSPALSGIQHTDVFLLFEYNQWNIINERVQFCEA